MPPFVHLHVHSEYSLVDGMVRPTAAPAYVASLGQNALAITDHGSLGGMLKAQRACEKAGITLIPGYEAYLAIGDRFERDFIEVPTDDSSADEGTTVADNDSALPTKKRFYEHLTLLAETETGWRNLVQLTNRAEESKYQGKPRMDYELISEHAEGLIILTGCLGGPVLGSLARGDEERARTHIQRMIDAVGKDNVYVEIMEHGIEEESRIVPDAVRLAGEFGLLTVATNDAHYMCPEDSDAHAAWLAHSSKSTLDNPKFSFHGAGYHLASAEEMYAKRPEPWWQQACANTQLVADRIKGRLLPEPRIRLPKFKIPDGYGSSTDYFIAQVKEGAAAIYGTSLPEPVRNRLNEEARVIVSMGFPDYFLIVAEMIQWAKGQGIIVGAGRGSAAGALTAYCLGITSVDPLEHDLLFERFLEPGRVGMPDIDTDFEAARRGEVLDHLAELYGHDHVAGISNYGFSRTKKALKDAARVLGLKPIQATKLADEVPVDGGKPLTFAQLADPTRRDADPFRAAVAAGGEDAARIVDLAQKFENLVSTIGIHACGFLIADEPIAQLLPLRRSKEGDSYTTWDGVDVDEFGLCKIDVLGLQNLDILAEAFRMIEADGGQPLSIESLPHPDTKGDPRVDAAWRVIRQGKTSGVFQLEGDGITETTVDIQPSTWDDLSAILAMYRPGPMAAGVHLKYGALKRGEAAVSYEHLTSDPREQEMIAGILDRTFGLLIMQEQAMQLGRLIAGFDASWRSKLRKAMGKKIEALMKVVGEKYFAQAVVDVYDEDTGELISPAFQQSTAERVWDLIKANAEYAFNASHTAAYAKTSFATAYVKANWPAKFGAALLSVVAGKDERRVKAFAGLQRDGIEVLPPHINLSGEHSTAEGDTTVRLGLSEIKGVSSHGTDIVRFRDTQGPITSFSQLHDITGKDGTPVPVSVIERLIEAGAMDDFGPRLGMLTIARSSAGLPIPPIEFGVIERGQRQRAAVLRSFGEHPCATFQEQIRTWVPEGIINVESWRQTLRPVTHLPERSGEQVSTIGVLSGYSERAYRGGKLAQIQVEGSRGEVAGVMWNDDLMDQKISPGMPAVGSIVYVRGRVRVRVIEIEDPETGETSSETHRELTVQRLETVDVGDRPRDAWPAPQLAAPVFASPGDAVEPQLAQVETHEHTEAAPREPRQPAPKEEDPTSAVRGTVPDDLRGIVDELPPEMMQMVLQLGVTSRAQLATLLSSITASLSPQ